MPFIVRVLQAANHGGRGPDELRQLSLREPGLRPKCVDLAGDFVIRTRLFQFRQHVGLAGEITAVDDVHGVGGRLFLFGHPYSSSQWVCASGSFSNRFLRLTAVSISPAGTVRSLARPWDTTAAALP